jgi:hypothetical protein
MSLDPHNDITASSRTCIPREGVLVPCTDGERGAWMHGEQGRADSLVGKDAVDGWLVVTSLEGRYAGSPYRMDETLVFMTTVWLSRTQWVVSRYRGLKAARTGHKRWVAIVRGRLAGDPRWCPWWRRGGQPSASPWPDAGGRADSGSRRCTPA